MELEENVQLETGNQETHNNVEESVKPIEKTFTQKEVNEIVKNRLDRERKKYPNDEELKKEYITYKNYNLVKNENVNELFIDFVIDKVSKQDGDFDENLKAFKKHNPQFFDTNKFIKMSTSPELENNKKEEQKKPVFKQFF